MFLQLVKESLILPRKFKILSLSPNLVWQLNET